MCLASYILPSKAWGSNYSRPCARGPKAGGRKNDFTATEADRKLFVLIKEKLVAGIKCADVDAASESERNPDLEIARLKAPKSLLSLPLSLSPAVPARACADAISGGSSGGGAAAAEPASKKARTA